MSDETLSLELLGQSYSLKCAPEDVQKLKQAGALLNGKMEAIKQDGLQDRQNIALMAGLKLALELQENNKTKQNAQNELVQRLNDVHTRIKGELDPAPVVFGDGSIDPTRTIAEIEQAMEAS